jgi:drug/metabolite transporter (DMT)-like permease
MQAVLSLIMSVTLGVVGQLFIKSGLNKLGPLDFSTGLLNSYIRIFFSASVLVGLFIYFFGVFFWLYGLSKVDLSFAYPFVSLSYVLVFLASWWLFGEHISALRWLGLGAICIGVYLISRT